MKRISIKMIKMLWKALTDERYVVVTLDEWNENAYKYKSESSFLMKFSSLQQ